MRKLTLAAVAFVLSNTTFITEAAFSASITIPVPPVAGDRSKAPISLIENDGTEIYALNQNGHQSLSIQKTGGLSSSIVLPEIMLNVTHIANGVGQKAIVMGYVNEALSEVVVLDLKANRISDSFLAYQPSISPDGKFVAFTKFYPTHNVNGTSDIVLLYDLEKSPLLNRAPGGEQRGDGMDSEIGIGVYPPNVGSSSPNADLPEAAVNQVTSGFYWSSDSSKLLFSVTNIQSPKNNNPLPSQNTKPQQEQTTSLILFDTSSPAQGPHVYAVDTCTLSKQVACYDHMTQLDFVDGGIRATFGSYEGKPAPKSVLVDYDRFYSTQVMK